MQDFTLPGVVGLAGVALYVLAYAAMQLGFVRGQTYLYAGTNLAAAACVLFSLTETYNLSSALIQIMWILISIAGMTRLWLIERMVRFSEEERRMLDAIAPGLPKDQASKLLEIGDWHHPARGEALIEEGRPAPVLGWLASGSLAVSMGGLPILSLGPGAVIGEMTYHDAAPASARIEALHGARLFCIDAARLRALISRNDAVATALERSIAHTLRGKLRTTSAELRDRASTAFSSR